jgi:hypothetical protein
MWDAAYSGDLLTMNGALDAGVDVDWKLMCATHALPCPPSFADLRGRWQA